MRYDNCTVIHYFFARHIIAVVHFNHNLHRETRKKSDGSDQIAVTYPKFKNGEATVRDVKVKANFGKQTFVLQQCCSYVHTCHFSTIECHNCIF